MDRERVLADGGCSVEALAPMREAVEQALHALLGWRGQDDASPALALIDATLIQTNLPPAETLSLVARLRDDRLEPDAADAGQLLGLGDSLLARAALVLESAQSG